MADESQKSVRTIEFHRSLLSIIRVHASFDRNELRCAERPKISSGKRPRIPSRNRCATATPRFFLPLSFHREHLSPLRVTIVGGKAWSAKVEPERRGAKQTGKSRHTDVERACRPRSAVVNWLRQLARSGSFGNWPAPPNLPAFRSLR